MEDDFEPIYLIHLECASSAVWLATEWLLNLCSQHSIGEEVTYRLDLCLNELVDNVVCYAKPCELEISLHFTSTEVILTLVDNGATFNPFTFPKPEVKDSVEDVQIGGVGIHLVRSFADKYSYLRQNGNNITTLLIKLGKSDAPLDQENTVL